MTNMHELSLVKVIAKYQSLIHTALSRLETCYGEVTLARIWDDEIPLSGDLPGISFHFHGTGCTARVDGYVVNWDWNREGQTREFEAWKPWQMTRDHADEFGSWVSLDVLKAGMELLCAQRTIEKVQDSTVLYRLAEGFKA